jgi:NAD(P)-dependent dehydrogenase (short-subunit alcohol dehydrogenase family)
MTTKQKTIIVTGASQGIGAAVANLFLDRGYNVVGNSRKITHRNELQSSENLALVDGDIGLASTAEMIVGTALKRFGSIDALVNNAGIFFPKPFTEYTPEDFRLLSSTNLDGFIHTTQLAVKQMLSQKTGGSVVSITASIADHPLAVFTASVPMITKGGIDAISRSLAMEYAPQAIRVNVVAPGIVDTPLHKNNPKDFRVRCHRWGRFRTPGTSQRPFSISPRRARSPARCCTLTAARISVGGDGYASLAKQLHLPTSAWRSARLDFGRTPRLLTALNTEHPSDHHRLQDPTSPPHTTPAHSACKGGRSRCGDPQKSADARSDDARAGK